MLVPQRNRETSSTTGGMNLLVAWVMFSVAPLFLLGGALFVVQGNLLMGLVIAAVAYFPVSIGRTHFRAGRLERAAHRTYLSEHPAEPGTRRPRRDPREAEAIRAEEARIRGEEWDREVQTTFIDEAESAGDLSAVLLLRSETPAESVRRLDITRPSDL